MMKDSAAEDFHLIGCGAAIGIFERDDLALFGHTEAAIDRACGLRRDRSCSRHPSPADRASPAMEKCDRNSAFDSNLGQAGLCFREFPIRRKKSAILVGVRIADNDFLN